MAKRAKTVVYPPVGVECELRYEVRVGRRIVTFVAPCVLSGLDIRFSGDPATAATFKLQQVGTIKSQRDAARIGVAR